MVSSGLFGALTFSFRRGFFAGGGSIDGDSAPGVGVGTGLGLATLDSGLPFEDTSFSAPDGVPEAMPRSVASLYFLILAFEIRDVK